MTAQTEQTARTIITTPVTLKAFFTGADIETADGPVTLAPLRIEIPRIQRSYAQGRATQHARDTRERFLSALYDTLSAPKERMTLDFTYGYIDDRDNLLTPLDGQQRLTTLYLLHWYASRLRPEAMSHPMFAPEAFTYKTRYSSRDFCKRLAGFVPDLAEGHSPLSHQIAEEQGWFPLSWNNDPTISSMLTMLDAIDAKMGGIRDSLWDALDRISFFMLDVRAMKQTDEIYVRMNSRGRQLTDFEHIKAEFIKAAGKCVRLWERQPARDGAPDRTWLKELGMKLDGSWVDMLWPYSQDTHTVDTRMLRLFRFTAKVITYRGGGTFSDQDIRDIDLIKGFFTPKEDGTNLRAITCNIRLLENIMDAWAKLGDLNTFFDNYIARPDDTGTYTHTPGKILARDLWPNPFKSWIDFQPDSRENDLRRLTLLYAFTTVLLSAPDLTGTTDFRRRLRIIGNLIKNSGMEIADRIHAQTGNRMPAILAQTDRIMLHGDFLNDGRANFHGESVDEEARKFDYTAAHPAEAPEIFRLEDHYLLDGRTDAVDFTRPARFDVFRTLFDTSAISRDLLDCALLSLGDYTVKTRSQQLTGTGDENTTRCNETWKRLLHEMLDKANARSLDTFKNLLDRFASPSDADLQSLVDSFKEECKAKGEYPWRYYYIKYADFRRKRYGNISLDRSRPAEMLTHYTKTNSSNNTQSPFLRALLDLKANYKVETDAFNKVPFKGGYLSSRQEGFVWSDDEGHCMLIHPEPIPTRFSAAGETVDLMDRIDYARPYAENFSAPDFDTEEAGIEEEE